MSQIVEIRIKGIEQTAADLRLLPVVMASKIVMRAMRDAIQSVQEAARNRVRVLHGTLLESIAISVSKKSNGNVQGKIGIDRNTTLAVGLYERGKHAGEVIYETAQRYAFFVEFGSSHAQAFPFLRPALAAQWQNAVARFQNNINEAIDEEVLANGPLDYPEPT